MAGGSSSVAIDLDSEEVASIRPLRGSSSGGGGSSSHPLVVEEDETAVVISDSDDDEVLIVAGAGSVAEEVEEVRAPERPSKRTCVRYDDDLEVTGTAGGTLAEDLPHARADCPLNRFVISRAKKTNSSNAGHCDQCWCFVCEVPADRCTQWTSEDCRAPAHCNAHAKLATWTGLRGGARRRAAEAAQRDDAFGDAQ